MKSKAKSGKYITKNITKRLISVILAVLIAMPLIVGGGFGATEEELDEKIRRANAEAESAQKRSAEILVELEKSRREAGDLIEQKNLIQQRMDAVQSRINSLNEVIELQKQAINTKQGEIDLLLRSIADTEEEIERSNKRIKALDEENEENLEKFGELIKREYMAGNQSYLDAILNSTGFYDLVVRTEVLRKAGEINAEFMNDLLDAIREQEELIESLEELWRGLDADRLLCEQEKSALEVDLAELNAGMVSLDAERAREYGVLLEHAQGIAELENDINNMNRQYQATQAQVEAANQEVAAAIQAKQALVQREDFSGDGFAWPLENRFRMVTCDYGYDSWRGGNHYGIDIGNSGINGTPIYAVQSGTVIRSVTGYGGGYGNHVVIDHGGGISTLYAHMQGASLYGENQEVTKGDVIGYVGSTGWSTGPHLHFEVRSNGSPVSPWGYIG